MTVAIPHRDVDVTVIGDCGGERESREGVRVQLFTEAGAAVDVARDTDEAGRATFHLPERAYRARVDRPSSPYWSAPFVWQDAEIILPEARTRVSVTRGSAPVGEAPVYVFLQDGEYLGVSGTTDASGSTDFRLPAGSYNFRTDVEGNRHWSGDVALAPHQNTPVEIPTGGASFTLRVEDGIGTPIENAPTCTVGPTGACLGASRTTSSTGEAGFDLPAGSYEFRVDRMGYSFPAGPLVMPSQQTFTLAIPHRRVTASVRRDRSDTIIPAPGVPVVLSDSNLLVTIPEGRAEVHVTGSGAVAAGVPVQVFSGTGVDLGFSSKTDEHGTAAFWLPAGAYRFRADSAGNEWFGAGDVTEGGVTSIAIDGP